MQWLRRSFIAGFFVTVPLVVSVIALVWAIRWADRVTSRLGELILGTPWPGLGLLVTLLAILAIGALTTNVLGRRVFQKSEDLLLHVPLFKTIYAPVKQLISAFSPDNDSGFKRMVLVEDQGRGALLGFLTKEFTVDRGRGPERLLAVYVPTNHLYLGDILVCSPDRASFPDLTVEEGIRIFLTGGTAMPDRMRIGTANEPRE
jgi:uncharacterized membrane protein